MKTGVLRKGGEGRSAGHGPVNVSETVTRLQKHMFPEI